MAHREAVRTTVLSTAAGLDAFEVFAEIARTELLVIDEEHDATRLPRPGARWNQVYFRVAQGLTGAPTARPSGLRGPTV